MSPEPPPATEIISAPGGGRRRRVRGFRLTGGPDGVDLQVAAPRFRVGSHEGNDLVLADPSVSRFHLELVAERAGFRIIDLESTNGSFVDGLRVRDAYLPQRAMLRLGQVSLTFEARGEGADLPASEQEEFFGVTGASAAMAELFAVLERAAPTDATVLITGESGTGKEMVAHAVHRASRRRAGPLVVLDCAAVPATLMEAELFGHEKGAFTGATEQRQGRFEEASGGTLFLDEIGELPLEMQPKLLRVLQSRQVRRIGGSHARGVDVRLVAATNRRLATEVNRGAFREDLYYRLAVVEVTLAPLRERPEDVRPLVTRFIQELEPRRAGEILRGISEDNWRRLEQRPWPGNVRELRNFIERTLILSGGPIDSEHVKSAPAPAGERGQEAPVDLDRPFTAQKAEVVATFEEAYLLGQLQRHRGNVSAAARAAGMDRMNFKRRLQKYR